MKELRVELRTRNNVLWHVIFDQHRSVADFCRRHGISNQSTVGGYLNLSSSPYGEKGLRRDAARLCTIAGLGADALFPSILYEGIIPNRLAAEVESSRFLPLAAAEHLALPAAQEDAALHREQRATIDAVLETLTPREARIVRQRFGLIGDEESLADIAAQEHVGSERIRQIEAKALRKLRHPSRSRPLRTFLELRPSR